MSIDICNTIPPGFDLISLGKDGPLQVSGDELRYCPNFIGMRSGVRSGMRYKTKGERE